MDDIDSVREVQKVKKTCKRKLSISKHQRVYRNKVRKVGRKRNKVKYYKNLKQLRHNRKTDDLCSAVGDFDIIDMEWAPTTSSAALPVEVTDWQKQEQIEYWKSRAISLELENKMLHQHIRDVYAKIIEENSQKDQYPNNNYTDLNNEEEQTPYHPEENQYKGKFRKKSGMLPNNSKTKPPVSLRVPSGKNRLDEMKKIYGEKAQKIMGMETVLQLNYEKKVDQLTPAYWPSIPLKLKFDQ